MAYLTIAIPCYDIKGMGGEVLNYSFGKLFNQTFKDFDIVVTDHSTEQQNDVENVCNAWIDRLDIKYYRNEIGRGSPSINTNFSIQLSHGKLIKLLCQDDYLYDDESLQKIVDAFTDDVFWLASSYVHSNDRVNFYNRHTPSVCSTLYVTNLIGTPSCITIRNLGNMEKIDENLYFAYDCEWYWRLLLKYGVPKILDEVTMVNYLWEGQTTNTIADQELRIKEDQYIIRKVQNA